MENLQPEDQNSKFKKMAKARKHEIGGLLDFIQPLIDNFKSGGKLI